MARDYDERLAEYGHRDWPLESWERDEDMRDGERRSRPAGAWERGWDPRRDPESRYRDEARARQGGPGGLPSEYQDDPRSRTQGRPGENFSAPGPGDMDAGYGTASRYSRWVRERERRRSAGDDAPSTGQPWYGEGIRDAYPGDAPERYDMSRRGGDGTPEEFWYSQADRGARTGRRGYGEGWGQSEAVQARYSGMGPHSGKGPRGYRRPDDRIREDVCEALTRDRDVDASDVDVAVAHGEVTLEGTVDTRHQKRRAEDVAEAVRGVLDVHNRLQAVTSMIERGGDGRPIR